MELPFESFEALWMLPVVQDVAVRTYSFFPSFLISVFSKVFLTSFAFLRSTFSLLQRITPTCLSRRLQPLKDWIHHRTLECDSLGKTLVLKLASKYPILTKRLSVILGALRERSIETLAQIRNNLGTNPLGRFSLKIIEWILRIVERPFVPFTGVVEISEINTDIPKDENDEKNQRSSILVRGFHLFTLGFFTKLMAMRNAFLHFVRSLRKSIFHTIRIGELKVNQTDEDFMLMKGSSSTNNIHKNHHFNVIFDGLKHLLIALKLSSDVGSDAPTHQYVKKTMGVKSLPSSLSSFKVEKVDVDTKIKAEIIEEKNDVDSLNSELGLSKLMETSSLSSLN